MLSVKKPLKYMTIPEPRAAKPTPARNPLLMLQEGAVLKGHRNI